MEEKQLPKEVVEQISKEEETLFDEIMDSGTSSPINQRLTAYASKLYQANETIKDLERWKAEAICLLSKIDDYADGHPEIKLGMGKVEFTIERAMKFDDRVKEAAVWVKADTKPEHNVGVLVFIPGEDNHITSGVWDISNKWVLLDEYRTPEEEVTHWMPLPAFPEGYTWNEIPDDLVDALKKVAKEELAAKQPLNPELLQVIRDAEKSKEEDLKAVKKVIGGAVVKIDREWINNALVEFALAYHRMINKDIANDAAEYLNDKLKEAGVIYVLSEDESAAGREDAVEFVEWSTERYAPVFEEGKIINWVEYIDKGNTEYTTAQLYTIFKQQKEK